MEKTKKSMSKSNTQANENIAVAYLRVSTTAQEDKGYSLENQLEKAMEYAQNNGLILDKHMIFIEPEPASKINGQYYEGEVYDNLNSRPKLQQIMKLARLKKFSHLITYTRDRLARDLEIFIGISMELKRKEISIHYSRTGEFRSDKGNVYNQFLDIILASIAEYEANVIASRVHLGCSSNVQNGIWAGGKEPFGYYLMNRYQKNKDTLLKPIPYEKSIVQDIFKYYTDHHLTYQEIANKIKEKYCDARNWTKSKVEAILKNETYTGYIVWNRRGGRRKPNLRQIPVRSKFREDVHIIDKHTWKSAEELRTLKYQDPKYFNTPFLLKGKLVCGKCFNHLVGKNYGSKKSPIYRCKTIHKEKGISELIVKKDMIEQEIEKRLSEIIDSSLGNTHEIWRVLDDHRSLQQQKVEASIKDLQSRIDRLRNIQAKTSLLLGNLEGSKDVQLKSAVEEQYVYIRQEITAYLHTIELLNKKLFSPIPTEENLSSFIDDIVQSFIPTDPTAMVHPIRDFKGMDHKDKRILMDMLIDSIIIDQNDEGKYSIEILLNIPI